MILGHKKSVETMSTTFLTPIENQQKIVEVVEAGTGGTNHQWIWGFPVEVCQLGALGIKVHPGEPGIISGRPGRPAKSRGHGVKHGETWWNHRKPRGWQLLTARFWTDVEQIWWTPSSQLPCSWWNWHELTWIDTAKQLAIGILVSDSFATSPEGCEGYLLL